MIPQSCLLIESMKFPILEEQNKELVSEGMIEKALRNYPQVRLRSVRIQAPFFCNEDWGCYQQADRIRFRMGLCIESDPDADIHPVIRHGACPF